MRQRAILLLLVVLVTAGCDEFKKTGSVLDLNEPDPEADAFAPGKGVGEPCSEDGDCRSGLSCQDSICLPTGSSLADMPCMISAECGDGLVCGFDLEKLQNPKTCKPAGDGEQWDICSTDLDCRKGYYCKPVGFTGSCQPEGDKDVGETCEDTDECFGGLACGATAAGEMVCGLLGVQLPPFLGPACAPGSEIGDPPRLLFEVPRSGVAVTEFYRLPFPNDARVKDGHLFLDGHPTPGPGVVGMDIVKRLIEVMERDLGAYGTNPVVFLRFSVTPADPLKESMVAQGEGQNMFLLDITDPQSDDYGSSRSINWSFSSGKGGNYICPNHLALSVPWSRPLDPGRTYVALVTDTIPAAPAEEGGAKRTYQRDADFAAVMGGQKPGNKDLGRAWEAYAPLRTFLAHAAAAELGLTADNVIGAAVFSTYDPRSLVEKAGEVLAGKGVPEIVEMVLCGEGVTSPCDDGLTGDEHMRGCVATDPAFYEFQGKVRLPSFQAGTLPYYDPDDGGRVEVDPTGKPKQKGVEEVCFALTVPKNLPMPEAGWPLVLYAHGTGGTYRSHVTVGVSGMLSGAEVWNPDTQAFDRPTGFMVLGYDQVMHGPRKGDTQIDTDSLVFNFRNPQAALGNFVQGAADNFSMLRMGEAITLTDAPFSTEAPATVDVAHLFFVGHSQGGTTGPLFLPFEPAIQAAVLSGAGGGLIDSLLRKFAPVDIKDGVTVALQDDQVSRTHPALALLQNYYDPVDPINFGVHLFHEPVGDMHKIRILQLYGLEDQHTPPATIKSLSAVMRADLAFSPTLAATDKDIYSGVNVVELPKEVTRGLTVEYKPDGDYEGHYVLFHHPDAIRHFVNFLGTAVYDSKPTVVE
ncbi:MAG: dickkopf-related protein [Pseudomonadota bacterium]